MKKVEVDEALAALWVLVREPTPIIIGSQALHGKFPDVADTILRSREVDIMLPNKAKLGNWLFEVVGEGTPFDFERGYFIDHVVASPDLPILADGWDQRAIRQDLVYDGKTQGVVRYLSPEDLAISKLGAMRPKDFEFVYELLAQRYVNLQDLQDLVPLVPSPAHRGKINAVLSVIEGRLLRMQARNERDDSKGSQLGRDAGPEFGPG